MQHGGQYYQAVLSLAEIFAVPSHAPQQISEVIENKIIRYLNIVRIFFYIIENVQLLINVFKKNLSNK